MKRGPHQRENKSLAKEGLVERLQQIFQAIGTKLDKKKRAGSTITLFDCFMSALAMFNLKSPSLLAFDHASREEPLGTNLKRLYAMQEIPSDTYMREMLDEVDPGEIRTAFTAIFSQAQRGKILENYAFIDGGYLVGIDGTGVFESQEIYCENCCKKRCGGVTVYYHQILTAAIIHPDKKQVIPLCPEPIKMQDGVSKNDCETNAANRFLDALKREHPHLRLTCTFDALFATGPFINGLKKRDLNYIIVAKPGSNKTLFEWLNAGEITLKTVKVVKDKNSYVFRYANRIPLSTAENAPFVNFFDCEATEVSGRKTSIKRFAWITSHQIMDDNIYDLMRGGRARWKIENETINTLKNQGYQFEHNFGHGKKNLHTVFALLMVLSFLIDQLQEAADGLFQLALKKRGTRRLLWEDIRSLFRVAVLPSWDLVFRALAFGFKPLELTLNTS